MAERSTADEVTKVLFTAARRERAPQAAFTRTVRRLGLAKGALLASMLWQRGVEAGGGAASGASSSLGAVVGVGLLKQAAIGCIAGAVTIASVEVVQQRAASEPDVRSASSERRGASPEAAPAARVSSAAQGAQTSLLAEPDATLPTGPGERASGETASGELTNSPPPGVPSARAPSMTSHAGSVGDQTAPVKRPAVASSRVTPRPSALSARPVHPTPMAAKDLHQSAPPGSAELPNLAPPPARDALLGDPLHKDESRKDQLRKDQLRKEVEMVDKLREALRQGNRRRAAQLIHHYRQTFPAGVLRQDVEILFLELGREEGADR